MNNLKHWKFGIFVFLAVLITAQSVKSLGVTRPVPYDIELMRGETAGFTFQIQTVSAEGRMSCAYSISGMEPLEITFEETETIVESGSVKNVYGSIKVPINAEIKVYRGKLDVSCGPLEEGKVTGSVVRTTIGGTPFNVNVVEVREKGIKEIGPPAPEIPYTLIIIVVVIIIIVAIGVYYWLRASKKGKK